MPPPRWTTPEQLQFLESKLDTFIEAQKKKHVDLFWHELQREWFEAWKEEGQDAIPAPEQADEHRRDLGKRIDTRIAVSNKFGTKETFSLQFVLQQLKNWYNNSAKTKKSTKKQPQFEFKAKATRLPQPAELFSSKYYTTHLKESVDQERGEQKKQIRMIKKKTRQCFEMAPKEIRQKVFDELVDMKKKKEESKKREANNDGAEHMPEEYAA